MTTGEGGMIVPTDADAAARLRSERNQGRAVDMGWLDHDRLGFNYRLSDVQAAIGLGPGGEAAAAAGASAPAVAARYAERLAEVPGVEAPIAARGSEVRSWFVYVVRLADEVDRDAVILRLRERGIDSKSYLPSIHLFPHIAALGYREGQFPIAEAASAHSPGAAVLPADERGADRAGLHRAGGRRRRDPAQPRQRIIGRPMARFPGTRPQTATLRRGSAKSPTRASGG